MEEDDRVKSLRLQIPDDSMRIGEASQLVMIFDAERLEMAQQERRPRSADRDLDLRHAIRPGHGLDQRLEPGDQGRNMRGQHQAGIHHRHVTAVLFAKAHQCPALAVDMAHGKPGPRPIGRSRSGNRREHLFGLEPGDMPQGIFQHALLGGGLAGKVEMLHRASAAGAEMRTRRSHPLTRGAQHAYGMGLFVAPLAPIAGVLDNFAGQGSCDENRLAVDMGDAATFMVQGFDVRERHGEWRGPFGKRR
jgi:hypothetical protein